MANDQGRDTQERILDAAERLFADRGFAGTSLRTITERAGVNLAAVNYHFGSKEALIEAVFSRRLEPLNRERIAQLQMLDGDPSTHLEQIIDAFIGPPLRMSRDPERGGAVFMRLLGHAMNQPKDPIRRLLVDQFQEVIRSFTAALKRTLPDLPDSEILWRMIFMAGSMSHTMVISGQVKELSKGLCDASNVEELTRRLVLFYTEAMRSPAPPPVGSGG